MHHQTDDSGRGFENEASVEYLCSHANLELIGARVEEWGWGWGWGWGPSSICILNYRVWPDPREKCNVAVAISAAVRDFFEKRPDRPFLRFVKFLRFSIYRKPHR
jgi:hypothetical protein